MVYIVKQKVYGKDYYYLRKSQRVGGKVKSIGMGYLGKTRKEAEKRFKEILKKEEGGEIKIIYFVHGTTVDNEKNKATGQAQGELSELGKKQSLELKDLIKRKKFDIIFTSDLKRAVDSTNLIFKNSKIKIIKDKRLRECNYGNLNQASEEKVVYLNHIEKPFPNGESLKDVEKRIKYFLVYLSENYSGKNIAVVAHKSPQLALDVLLKNKTWVEAIKEDWRLKKAWQPGWEYFINSKNKSNSMDDSKLEHREISIDEMAVFCKRKGFVYPSGEIYGGLAGFWDFGHLGSELKKNLKNEWWNFHIQQREDIVGIDGAIITNPKVWEASGHVKSFVDVAVVCEKCGFKTKIDKHEVGKVKCEKCGHNYINKGEFNPMFQTQVGPVKDDSILAYLRPETAQLIFADFKLVSENARLKLPFGIAQVGKSFRNEISPREFLFRSREFEQMEIEYFIEPNMPCPYMEEIKGIKILVYDEKMQKENQEPKLMEIYSAWKNKIIKTDWHAYWIAKEFGWFVSLGANPENFRIRQHGSEEKSHYAIDTWDIEYKFPMGWRELQGFANRGDFDLKQHQEFSKEKMEINEDGKKFIPHVVCEPSLGVERAFLVFMFDSYFFDEKRDNIVLKLHPKLAPVKAAVFPIVKQEKFENFARKIFDDLKKEFNVLYDKSGSIGRRYARNDEMGTPFCITIDGDSLKNKDVTIRDRDTTKQIRVKFSELKEVLKKLINREIQFEKAGKLMK